jgi:hypothetical protein
MGLPPGEVDLYDVMEWAEEQSMFLRTPGQRLVLWYLCVHAFRREDNPEGRGVGDVLSAFTSIARIQRGTGLGRSTVLEALETLQYLGYLVADLKPGNGRSRISLFWTEGSDERRADDRDGIRALPKGFRKTPQRLEIVKQDAIILPFQSSRNRTNDGPVLGP